MRVDITGQIGRTRFTGFQAVKTGDSALHMEDDMDWIEGMKRLLTYIEEQPDGRGTPTCGKRRVGRRVLAVLPAAHLLRADGPSAVGVHPQPPHVAGGQELRAQGAKVIDVALKYGYETPESFQKAFTRFHGISPSAARRPDAKLTFMGPCKSA